MSEPMSKLSNFTFGVELEFILAYQCPDRDYRYEDEIEDEMYEVHIRQPLRRAGLEVHGIDTDYSDSPEICYQKWNVKVDETVEATRQDFDRINGTFANGFQAKHFDDFSYLSVEVVSPVLTFSPEAMQEVQIAVETICKQTTFAPRSSGLHVHLGNGLGERGSSFLSLPLLKNLAVLTTCFEQQWNQACPPHRIDNFLCQLPRDSFLPEQYNRQVMAKVIYDLPDSKTLVRRLHVGAVEFDRIDPYYQTLNRCKAINYLNHAPFLDFTMKRTVEFRQQAGTIDPRKVLRWIVTVGAMVAIANEYSPDIFYNVINRHYHEDGREDWTFSLLELFEDFGVEWLRRFWENELYTHEEYCPRLKEVSLVTSSRKASSRPKPRPRRVLDE